uniref:Uncharacterized protein n=1 Tax=Arundo donax TaxID=35708 RepID=A0A0A9C6C9_ARUDO
MERNAEATNSRRCIAVAK